VRQVPELDLSPGGDLLGDEIVVITVGVDEAWSQLEHGDLVIADWQETSEFHCMLSQSGARFVQERHQSPDVCPGIPLCSFESFEPEAAGVTLGDRS
jgi:hypothetical protein